MLKGVRKLHITLGVHFERPGGASQGGRVSHRGLPTPLPIVCTDLNQRMSSGVWNMNLTVALRLCTRTGQPARVRLGWGGMSRRCEGMKKDGRKRGGVEEGLNKYNSRVEGPGVVLQLRPPPPHGLPYLLA